MPPTWNSAPLPAPSDERDQHCEQWVYRAATGFSAPRGVVGISPFPRSTRAAERAADSIAVRVARGGFFSEPRDVRSRRDGGEGREIRRAQSRSCASRLRFPCVVATVWKPAAGAGSPPMAATSAFRHFLRVSRFPVLGAPHVDDEVEEEPLGWSAGRHTYKVNRADMDQL